MILGLVVGFLFWSAVPSKANHAWGNYHWARTANPFTVKLGDNLTSNWEPILATASADWSLSTVLDTTIVSGSTTAKRCKPTSGRVEVCNSAYGNNGWLGVAQIWVSGDHITQGTTKLNDTYFNKAAYNTTAWRNLVVCQEVGHTFGLDHQDEIFNNPNLGTCMDYTNDPSTNQHPNQHDYEELGIIYAHLDSFTTLLSSTQKLPFGESEFENRSDWGKEIRNNGSVGVYMRELGGENKLFTFVVWARL